MTKLMETICGRTCDAMVKEILSGDGEYLVRESRQQEEVERLSRALDSELALRVDNLLSEQLAIGELRESAYFRAGFRMALELTQ